ncbi:hypothetical protein DFH29DRAFT_1064934 [Suillus ampliporus]|nr:hypothetical protein DFH29DRAFT_1064934 [Suillus ampliporus]
MVSPPTSSASDRNASLIFKGGQTWGRGYNLDATNLPQMHENMARLILAPCKVKEFDQSYSNPSSDPTCTRQTCKTHFRHLMGSTVLSKLMYLVACGSDSNLSFTTKPGSCVLDSKRRESGANRFNGSIIGSCRIHQRKLVIINYPSGLRSHASTMAEGIVLGFPRKKCCTAAACL